MGEELAAAACRLKCMLCVVELCCVFGKGVHFYSPIVRQRLGQIAKFTALLAENSSFKAHTGRYQPGNQKASTETNTHHLLSESPLALSVVTLSVSTPLNWTPRQVLHLSACVYCTLGSHGEWRREGWCARLCTECQCIAQCPSSRC